MKLVICMTAKFSFRIVNHKWFYFLQDQKAHEAILKVLDLQWYVIGPKYYKLIWMALFLEYLHVLFLLACSVGKVPREPKLAEWTDRASKCDKMKTPVSFLIIWNFELLFINTKSTTLAYNNQCLILWCKNFQVRIAMVGKYTGLSDSYLSVLKVTLCFYIFGTVTVLNEMCKYVDLIFPSPFVRLFCMHQLLWTGNLWWIGFLPVILKILLQKRWVLFTLTESVLLFYVRELTDKWGLVSFADSWRLWESMEVTEGKHKNSFSRHASSPQ